MDEWSWNEKCSVNKRLKLNQAQNFNVIIIISNILYYIAN